MVRPDRLLETRPLLAGHRPRLVEVPAVGMVRLRGIVLLENPARYSRLDARPMLSHHGQLSLAIARHGEGPFRRRMAEASAPIASPLAALGSARGLRQDEDRRYAASLRARNAGRLEGRRSRDHREERRLSAVVCKEP